MKYVVWFLIFAALSTGAIYAVGFAPGIRPASSSYVSISRTSYLETLAIAVSAGFKSSPYIATHQPKFVSEKVNDHQVLYCFDKHHQAITCQEAARRKAENLSTRRQHEAKEQMKLRRWLQKPVNRKAFDKKKRLLRKKEH